MSVATTDDPMPIWKTDSKRSPEGETEEGEIYEK